VTTAYYSITASVCICGYLLSDYLDLSVNFMVANNPVFLKWKFGFCGCLQKLCKLCLWYCDSTSNYSKINSHAWPYAHIFIQTSNCTVQ